VVDEATIGDMREEARANVAEGARQADEADFPDPSSAARNVYADVVTEDRR
jgi:TPP-dependent pyruvate/acetoin dehydrogenase alpha subunit